jgi:hypothetical protein
MPFSQQILDFWGALSIVLSLSDPGSTVNCIVAVLVSDVHEDSTKCSARSFCPCKTLQCLHNLCDIKRRFIEVATRAFNLLTINRLSWQGMAIARAPVSLQAYLTAAV